MKTTAYLIITWFFLIALAGLAGIFNPPPGAYPVALGAALLLLPALYALDRRSGGGVLFKGIRRMELGQMVLIQMWRVGGFFFLVEWWRGDLPGVFALTAGIGDVAVGLAAPALAAGISLKQGNWKGRFLVWNTLGLLDLAAAVTLGVLYSHTPWGILAGDLSTVQVVRYPLILVPAFVVPVSVILHVEGFLRLREKSV
jgi:hypothetical protein